MALDVVSAFLSDSRMWIFPQIADYFLVQKGMQLMTEKNRELFLDCVQNVKY